MVVKTRNNGSRKRGDKLKAVAGCICCSEKDGNIKHEKTKCGNLITHNGKPSGNTFIHLKNISKVSKKPSGKRSPITHCTIALFKQNCIIQEAPKNGYKTSTTLEGGNRGQRSNSECMNQVSNWLRQFQQNVNIQPQQQEEPMEDQQSSPDQSAPDRSPQAPDLAQQVPAQSTGSPQQAFDNAPELEQQVAQEEVVETIQHDAESSSAGVVYYPPGGPPSAVSDVSESSVSAPSPGSIDDMSVTTQGEVSSPASQDEQPDSTSSGAAASARPKRTAARREKQRIASAKSRRKKNAENDLLKEKAKELEDENARLVKTIERLEIERKRYLSGEKNEIDYDPLIYDPQDDSDDDDNAAAGASALS